VEQRVEAAVETESGIRQLAELRGLRNKRTIGQAIGQIISNTSRLGDVTKSERSQRKCPQKKAIRTAHGCSDTSEIA
jgi:hypothetical protein